MHCKPEARTFSSSCFVAQKLKPSHLCEISLGLDHRFHTTSAALRPSPRLSAHSDLLWLSTVTRFFSIRYVLENLCVPDGPSALAVQELIASSNSFKIRYW